LKKHFNVGRIVAPLPWGLNSSLKTQSEQSQ